MTVLGGYHCDYYQTRLCKSCSLIEQTYSQQLSQKRDFVLQELSKAGLNAQVQDCHASEPIFGSRNKAKMVIGGSSKSPKFGILDQNYLVNDIRACPLLLPSIKEFFVVLAELMPQYAITTYDIQKRKGEFKFCIVRASQATQELQVRYVLRSKNQISKVADLAGAIHKKLPTLKVSSVNIQPIHQAVLEGPEEIILSSLSWINEQIGNYHFCLSPQSFWQVTTNVALKLYQYAAKFFAEIKPSSVLDLYCGAGAFSIFSAEFCQTIQGVELSPVAIQDAKNSAVINQLSNLNFKAADASSFLSQSAQQYDAIIVNPPRRGIGELLPQILEIGPQHIFYSSCNPQSLAHDLKVLSQQYQILAVQPFDMFPLTPHVEVAVTLRRFR